MRGSRAASSFGEGGVLLPPGVLAGPQGERWLSCCGDTVNSGGSVRKQKI